MKKMIILGIILFFLLIIYHIDREFYMPQRIKSHLWEFETGEYNILGSFIHSDDYYFSSDTMIFFNGKKVIVKYQYFGTLLIKDVETDNKATYEMKGTNWLEEIFK